MGFYAAFIVAQRVVLTTRRAGLPAADGVRWESDGKGSYTVQPTELPDRGTTIVLHLRDDEDDLLAGYRLRSIIQKYSDHISLPILMPGAEDTDDVVNQGGALWARPKSELSPPDYTEFYRHIAGDPDAPLGYLHSKVEGRYEYTLLLFIPSRAPYDLWLPKPRQGVRLHVRRVFIMDDTGQLMPVYLRFVRGVIDSSDLPLNVSRELLQSSRAVDNIRSNATRKVLKLLKDLAEQEPDKYATFWAEFGAVLKEGVPDDYANRDDIAALLRFTSTRSAGQAADVSLSDYVARMKDGQDKIYYLLAPSPAAAESSPHLEAFRAKGIEVLLLGHPVDNWVVSSLPEFGGRKLQSVAQGTADFGDLQDEAEQQAAERASAEFAGLLGELREILGGKVFDVRVSSRLTTSPACIVANEPDLDINLAHRLRGTGLPRQPVLEINPQHPLVRRLNAQPREPRLADWAHVLYNQAVLTLGGKVEDPAEFITRLNALLVELTGAGAE